MTKPRDVAEVHVEHVPGVDVVTVAGALTLTTVSALRDVAFDSSLCTQPMLLLDLDPIEFLDSQGIATIVAIRRRMAARGGELVLACSDSHLLKLLRISRLDEVLRVVPSPQAVLLDHDPHRECDDDIA